MNIIGQSAIEHQVFEIAVVCQGCDRLSIYRAEASNAPMGYGSGRAGDEGAVRVARDALRNDVIEPKVSEHIPKRISDLFIEAAACRQLGRHEAAGAIFRKTVDVASKHVYANDARLTERKPADALRSRLKALGDMKILDEDIVELADVAALDGNDAVHDIDPYTAAEAEALEELTADLLDRLFVRPAKLAAVRAKQIASGQRKA